jgi:hypothetical protein
MNQKARTLKEVVQDKLAEMSELLEIYKKHILIKKSALETARRLGNQSQSTELNFKLSRSLIVLQNERGMAQTIESILRIMLIETKNLIPMAKNDASLMDDEISSWNIINNRVKEFFG